MSKNFPTQKELDKLPIWVISVNTFTGIEYMGDEARTRSIIKAKHFTKKEAISLLPDCPKGALIERDAIAQVCI